MSAAANQRAIASRSIGPVRELEVLWAEARCCSDVEIAGECNIDIMTRGCFRLLEFAVLAVVMVPQPRREYVRANSGSRRSDRQVP
jgi:hypothetical protein